MKFDSEKYKAQLAKPRSTVLTTRINPEVRALLKKLAHDEHMGITDLLTVIAMQVADDRGWLKKNGEIRANVLKEKV